MKLHDIFEGIPMGFKALNTPLKHNYTFGFEIEVHVDLENVKLARDEVLDITSEEAKINILNNVWADLDDPYADGKRVLDSMIVYLSADFNKKKVDFNKVLKHTVSQDKRKYYRNLIDLFEKIISVPAEAKQNLEDIYSNTNEKDLIDHISNLRKKINDWADKLYLFDDYTFEQNGKYVSVYNSDFNEPQQRTSILSKILDHFNFDDYIYSMYSKNPERYIQNTSARHAYARKVFSDVMNIENVVTDQQVNVGVEVISKPYPSLAGMKDLFAALKVIEEDSRLYTSQETGLHINIGTFTVDDIDILKFFAIMGQTGALSLEPFNRFGNRFAQQVDRHVWYGITYNKDSANLNEYDKLKDFRNSLILSLVEKYDYVNFSKLKSQGFIEFRAMGGKDYETKVEEIQKQTKRLLRSLDIARDPNAYRKEYFQLLVRLQPKHFNGEGSVIKTITDILKIGDVEILSDTLENKQSLFGKIGTLLYYRKLTQEKSHIIDNMITASVIKFVKNLEGILEAYQVDQAHDLIKEYQGYPKIQRLIRAFI